MGPDPGRLSRAQAGLTRFPSAAGRASIAGMEQRAICIETLADLVAHGYRLNAMCERCRHRADLDMQG